MHLILAAYLFMPNWSGEIYYMRKEVGSQNLGSSLVLWEETYVVEDIAETISMIHDPKKKLWTVLWRSTEVA